MPINSLIFDLDGTLIDSSDGVVEAVNYAFNQMGIASCPPEVIKPYIGYPLKEMFADLTPVSADLLYDHFQVRARTSVVDSSVMLERVDPTLRELRERGYKMAIATTKIGVHVDAIIRKFGWEDLFDAAVAGNDVSRVKPHPESIHLAIARLGATPDESMVIGDTENDVLAAQGVPTRAVALLSLYGGHDRVTKLNPDFIISALPELIPILDRLNAVRTSAVR